MDFGDRQTDEQIDSIYAYRRL